MSILVIAEHDHSTLNSVTLKAIAAARKIDAEVGFDVLVAGYQCMDVASEASVIAGVSKVLLLDAPHYAAQNSENIAAWVVENAAFYHHIVATATTFGRNLLPRVAALLDVEHISDVVEVISTDTYIRPIYAGNGLARVQSSDSVKVITVRSIAFEEVGSGGKAVVEQCLPGPDLQLTEQVGQELPEYTRPEFRNARVVVSGGRGVGSAKHYHDLLVPLADKLGAALGASRAAVDAGYVSNDCQIGQTGKVVAPELYIAVGISGAIQHQAGMRDSKVIVAINKDPKAPIFEIADYGLVADLFDVLPVLTAALD